MGLSNLYPRDEKLHHNKGGKKMKVLQPPFNKRDGARSNPAKARPLIITEIRYTDGSVEKPGKGIVKPNPKKAKQKVIRKRRIPKL